MNKLNENIFHQYNKWKKNYVRKENTIKIRVNEFLDKNPKFEETLSISDNETFVNCSGSISIYDEDLIDGKLPFPFGKVNGNFDCSACTELISLEGAPKEVVGYFDCSNCPNLTSLEGAPKEVGSGFNCSYCENLKSLEGAPEKTDWNFDCTDCPNLTSLEYLPKEINGALKVDKRFREKIPSDIKIIIGIQYY